MFRIIILLLPLLCSLNVAATAQAPDYLIYNGEKHRLHVNPLEELFFEKENLRPKTGVISTGNWRGYIATFSIKDRSLVVSDITISKPDPDKEFGYVRESVLIQVFPNESDRTMDWFSGVLVVPLGDLVEYVHLSYASLYEKYLLIRIKNGRVVEAAEMSYEEYMGYKVRQFEKFKASSEYKNIYNELSKDRDFSEGFDLEEFIFEMGEFTLKMNVPFKSPIASSTVRAKRSGNP